MFSTKRMSTSAIFTHTHTHTHTHSHSHTHTLTHTHTHTHTHSHSHTHTHSHTLTLLASVQLPTTSVHNDQHGGGQSSLSRWKSEWTDMFYATVIKVRERGRVRERECVCLRGYIVLVLSFTFSCHELHLSPFHPHRT